MPATGVASIGPQNSVNFVFDQSVATTNATETFAYTVTRSFQATGFLAVAKAAVVGATVQAKNGATAISAALAVAALDTFASGNPTGAGSGNASAFAVGDTLNIVVATAGGICKLFINGIALPAASPTTVAAV